MILFKHKYDGIIILFIIFQYLRIACSEDKIQSLQPFSYHVTFPPCSKYTDRKLLKLIKSHIDSRPWHYMCCLFPLGMFDSADKYLLYQIGHHLNCHFREMQLENGRQSCNFVNTLKPIASNIFSNFRIKLSYIGYFPHLLVSTGLHLICRSIYKLLRHLGEHQVLGFQPCNICFCDHFLTHLWSWHLYVWLLSGCAILPGHGGWSVSREFTTSSYHSWQGNLLPNLLLFINTRYSQACLFLYLHRSQVNKEIDSDYLHFVESFWNNLIL